MTLDNKEQKELLLNIIKNVQIGGNLEQAKKTIVVIQDLLKTVQEAKIQEKKKNDN
ncbi:MAG: hypothetical protein ACTSPI_17970 [Candidatus Heimdallarchaeaceae archaeon]